VNRESAGKGLPTVETTLHAIREIVSAEDPLWEDWHAIYLASFPAHERMSSEFLTQLLAEKATGEDPGTHILVMTGDEDTARAICIGLVDIDLDAATAYLWYLATQPGARGGGIGARMYHHIRERARLGGASVLMFEVEIPQVAAARSEEDGEWAARRIAWYRRQGARVLHGIQYFQSVDASEEVTEMHLMADLLEPLTPDEVLAKARKLFADSMTEVGQFGLD